MKRPRLLVIEMHHLGDAVLALPFLRAASLAFDVQVACRPTVAGFLRDASPESHPISCDRWSEFFRQIPKLGGGDVAVSIWPDPRAHLALRLSGAERRVGLRIAEQNMYGIAQAWRRRRLVVGEISSRLLSLAGPPLTHPLDRFSERQTQLETWLHLAQALGLVANVSIPWLPAPSAPEGFQEFVQACRTGGRQVAVVHAGGRLPSKRWPLERFEALLRGWFPTHRVAAAIIRAPGEDSPTPHGDDQQIFEPPSAAALAGMLARADGVLCNDSFPAHLAAASGVPVVTIFGSGDPAWFAPFENAARTVSANTCPFRPCVDRCVQPSFLCLDGVSIRLVEEKLSAMFPNAFNPTTL